MQSTQIVGDSFACCSRYNKCSDEKRCVIEDEDYSELCQYRASLEVGRIFYGKNSIYFSNEKYQDILSKINSLTESEKNLLNEIYVYCRHNKCMSNVYWSYSDNLNRLSDYGLIDISNCHDWVLDNYKSSELEALVLDTKYNNMWQEYKSEAKKNNNSFVLKNFFIPWVKQNARDILKKLDVKYRLVSIPYNGTYADEYLKDFSIYENLNRDIIHPFKNDSCFLKLSY